MSKKTNAPYKVVAKNESEAELLVYGDIGENWWGESVTAKNVVEQLSKLEVDTIYVRINSYGGAVSDGLAIFNALKRHPANIVVVIEGVAVSIASLIAMAGDTVEMGENALFMVHAPWGGAVGNSKEMREYADVLDKYAEAMASSYVRKTGQDHDTIMSLLTDGIDHYYLADEAQEFGFVDKINEEEMAAAAAGFDKSKFVPSALRAQAARLKELGESLRSEEATTSAAVAATHQPEKETTMLDKKKETATEPKVVDEQAIADKAVAKAQASERKRKTGIRSSFAPHVKREGVQAVLDTCMDDDAITVEAAQAQLLTHLGNGAEPLAKDPHVETGQDAEDKLIAASMDVLLVRAGAHRMKGNGIEPLAINLQGNPHRGAGLMDMARASLRRNGTNPDGMNKQEVVAAAFQTTDDFPTLLENTMHKILQMAYSTAPDTWSRFCKIGEVSDLRAHNRYRVGSIANLDSLNEHGELRTKTIPDAEKGTITATTKGNIIGITREAIINDDLQALTDLAKALGRAFKRTIEAAVYSLLAENGGLGPTMNDALPLFDAGHSNIGAGAAISMVAIDANRVIMASQTDVGGNDYIDITASKLLLPIGLGGTARSINNAQYDPDTANKLQKPNIVNGLFTDIIDTPRLTGTRRYMFADPNDAPVIEVAFLDGVQEPIVETKNGWSSAGAELRVLGDFGVDAIDYRGALTDAGA